MKSAVNKYIQYFPLIVACFLLSSTSISAALAVSTAFPKEIKVLVFGASWSHGIIEDFPLISEAAGKKVEVRCLRAAGFKSYWESIKMAENLLMTRNRGWLWRPITRRRCVSKTSCFPNHGIWWLFSDTVWRIKIWMRRWRPLGN